MHQNRCTTLTAACAVQTLINRFVFLVDESLRPLNHPGEVAALASSLTSRSLGLRRAHRRMAASAHAPVHAQTCSRAKPEDALRRSILQRSCPPHVRQERRSLSTCCCSLSQDLGWWWWLGGRGGGGSVSHHSSHLTSLLLLLNCRSAH